MEGEQQIDGVIGNGSKTFGGHQCDARAARKMLKDAVDEGEGFDRYCDKIERAYRKKLPSTPEGEEKLREQMQRVRLANSYFDQD